ncbi:MAG: Panacea domain-containing protein [Gemmatimonadota bacterium]
MSALQFREDKATQASALFLKLGSGRMNIVKLIKLLYLADRTSLIQWGRPLTFDTFFSLKNGPICSSTLNLINDRTLSEAPRYWRQFISERTENDVLLTQEPENDQLSAAEESLIKETYERFGSMTEWQLVEYTHRLPEWQNPGSSRLPILLRDILVPEGYSETEAEEIASELEYVSKIHSELR